MDTPGNRKRNLIVLICLGVAGAAVVAVTMFGVPLRSLLFYGLIALCPLMHLFMGHGAHAHDASAAPGPAVGPSPSESEER